jgi:uncharacterized protein YndB with AHSA1/START domain
MKIRMEREYPHPTEVVWRALTDPRAIRQWWVDTDFEAQAGREFIMRDVPQGKWDGVVRGRVLESEPPRRVRFTWKGGGHETVITYELRETPDGGTRFILTHEGFRGVAGLFLMATLRFGWRGLMRRILPETAAHIAAHGFAVPFPSPSKAQRSEAKMQAV